MVRYCGVVDRVLEWSVRMSQTKKIHPALKHGGYAATALLPGEDFAEFEKLHHRLVAEFAPTGPLEADIVATIARLMWRKQHLGTLRCAELARDRANSIKQEKRSQAGLKSPAISYRLVTMGSYEGTLEETERAAEADAQKELGDTYELIEIGAIATLDYLNKELAVEDRLDAMIDRCLKRLLLLSGLKSLAPAPQLAPPPSPQNC
jgi:hypothetical protein